MRSWFMFMLLGATPAVILTGCGLLPGSSSSDDDDDDGGNDENGGLGENNNNGGNNNNGNNNGGNNNGGNNNGGTNNGNADPDCVLGADAFCTCVDVQGYEPCTNATYQGVIDACEAGTDNDFAYCMADFVDPDGYIDCYEALYDCLTYYSPV